jgi:hypothetical protein
LIDAIASGINEKRKGITMMLEKEFEEWFLGNPRIAPQEVWQAACEEMMKKIEKRIKDLNDASRSENAKGLDDEASEHNWMAYGLKCYLKSLKGR